MGDNYPKSPSAGCEDGNQNSPAMDRVEKSKSDFEGKYGLRKWVYRLIVTTVCVGLIIPYAVQVVCTLWFPEVGSGVEIWNDFVGIILGVVATILSIVSMIMSFKNYDDTLEIQEKFTESLDTSRQTSSQAGQIITSVNELSRKIESIYLSTSTTSTDVRSNTWGKEPEEKR